MPNATTTCTAFLGTDLLATGPLSEIARIALAREGALVFDDASGRIIDLDPRDWTDPPPASAPDPAPKPRRGRPKLGVTPREVTLLPRHWEWLAAQPGGASAALRRLVDAARKSDDGRSEARQAAYRVLQAVAGDLPHYEEALRALFAGDLDRFAAQMREWPEGLRVYALSLADPSRD